MTANLKIYILFSILWSVCFFVALNWGTALSSDRWPQIVIAAIIYAVGFAGVGYSLQKSDNQSKVRFSLEHAYSAVSQIVSVIIGSIWLILFKSKDAWTLALYLPFFTIFAILGYLEYKKSIKGMDKKELFK